MHTYLAIVDYSTHAVLTQVVTGGSPITRDHVTRDGQSLHLWTSLHNTYASAQSEARNVADLAASLGDTVIEI